MNTTNSGATRTLFIDPQYVRDNSVINDNTEGGLISKAIRTASDKYIQPIIGGNLYNSLISKIQLNSLSGDYKTLMDDFIVPCLLEYTIYEYIPYSFKFRNKGISRQTSPDSIPAEVEDLTYIRDNVLQTAQFYGETLVRFLSIHAPNFPELSTSQADQINRAKGDYFGGIHVPGQDRGYCGDGFGLGIGIPINY